MNIPRYRVMRPLALALLFAGLFVFASSTWAQEDYDWLDEDLPEWVEDIGYMDEDYDGPELPLSQQPAAARESQSAQPKGTARQCRKCDCIWCREQLTGDWCGRRTCMAQNGIIYRGRITQFFYGVAGGVQEPVPAPFAAIGIEGGDTFKYTGNSQHDFLVDLDKFGGPQASRFVLTLENIWGDFGNVSFNTGSTTPSHYLTHSIHSIRLPTARFESPISSICSRFQSD